MRESYTRTLRSLYLMATIVSAIALILSFWVKHYDLDQALETDHGLEGTENVKLEGFKDSATSSRTGKKSSMKREKV